jgi:hypothetical protein
VVAIADRRHSHTVFFCGNSNVASHDVTSEMTKPPIAIPSTGGTSSSYHVRFGVYVQVALLEACDVAGQHFRTVCVYRSAICLR